jgi:hypothetical protein
MWLQVESAILDGLDRTATFLVAIPFDTDLFPRAWGFWNLPTGPRWIGRRHTNFVDGSVCAFVPDSGAWRPGDRLDSLIDLYSVWALRHLYLEQFGRWPGAQYSPHPFYSLVEFKDEEFCGCDLHDPPLRYGECCKPDHRKVRLGDLQTNFEQSMRCRITDRNPPGHVLDFILNRGELRPVRETLAGPAVISRPTR